MNTYLITETQLNSLRALYRTMIQANESARAEKREVDAGVAGTASMVMNVMEASLFNLIPEAKNFTGDNNEHMQYVKKIVTDSLVECSLYNI